MEMGRSGNGGGRKAVTFDDAITGRRRNGSLSSYLDMDRDAGNGGRAAPPRPLPLPAHGMGSSRRRTYADGELDVFAAERYFRGAMGGGDGDRKQGASVGVHVIAPTVPAAASARTAAVEEAVVVAKPSPSSTRASTASFAASSACSANSQTALFPRPRRRSRGEGCCVKVGLLMRTCSGKRSVRVDGCAAKEAAGAAKPAAATGGIDWYRELRMHKAVLSGDGGNSHGHGLVAAGGLQPPSLNLGTAKVAAIGREEKEVTLSSSTRRRSSFTLVAPVVRANVPASGEPGGAGKGGRAGDGTAQHLHGGGDGDDDDDAGSESSSDLFEIKSLMIGDCCPYEPSEASIQWSVVTAATASERGDRVPARLVGSGGARGPAAVAGRKVGGHRPPGLLAGCASHMAVDVSPAATTKGVPNAVAAMAVQQRRSEGFQKGWSGA